MLRSGAARTDTPVSAPTVARLKGLFPASAVADVQGLSFIEFSIAIVSTYGAPWVVLARMFLKLPEKWQSHCVSGSLTEFFALLFVLAPVPLLTLILTDVFTQNSTALTAAAFS